MALILRTGGSQSPDRWLREPRNNQWSQRTGGRSALDYLIKVKGYNFLEAVELLAEKANIQPPISVSENVPMEKQLLLPKKNQDDQKVITYLSGRGIDKEIIQFCLESGRVYESAFHHNHNSR